MIDTALGGMRTRYTNAGVNPGLCVLASSKRSEKSFLEVHMRKKVETEPENTLIVDEATWNVRPASEYSGKVFFVALGNKFLASEVIPDGGDTRLWSQRGYQILRVPAEYRAAFHEDVERALCDYAGISSSDITKYISGARLLAVQKKERRNPMTKEVIEVGNGPDDHVQYYDFFDLSRVPPEMKSKPLYMHFDMSISGDRTGVAGVWAAGKRVHQQGVADSAEMFFKEAFHFAVEAPKGHQVSFEKNRQFIYWLKSQGFNIKSISSDSFQSADLAQQLSAKGYNYTQISVDRVDSDDQKNKLCKPYQYFRSAIYDEKIEMCGVGADLLTTEITDLERNINTGRVDHPDGGKRGCFTGDTKVKLVDGRDLTFLELVDEYSSGKTNWVYSFNEAVKRIEPKRIEKAWCTLHNQPLLEVELDNGEKIRCTYNHRFMLRDGSYQEAQHLVEGQSLMPLYTRYPEKGLYNYRMYYEPIENKWHYEHR